MDLSAAEDSYVVRLACGLALAIGGLILCARFALDRTFIEVRRAVIGGLIVVEKADSITGDLDRLATSQRAFLSTGDERFAVEVAESIMALSYDLGTLEQISGNLAPARSYVAVLSHRVDLALASIRKTYDLQQRLGSGAAIAMLNDNCAVDDAKQEAVLLKRAATGGMFGRVQMDCRLSSILEVLF
jgi:CHASE3 domain sensor protein